MPTFSVYPRFTGDYRINDPRDQDCCWLLRDYTANMSVSAICVKPGIRTASTYKMEENNIELLIVELNKISIMPIYNRQKYFSILLTSPYNDKVYHASSLAISTAIALGGAMQRTRIMENWSGHGQPLDG